MRYIFMVLILCLISCGEFEEELTPNMITIKNNLPKGLRTLLEIAIEEEVCHHIEKKGFECNIPDQLDGIYFHWEHDEDNTVRYILDFCLKDNCQEETQTQN